MVIILFLIPAIICIIRSNKGSLTATMPTPMRWADSDSDDSDEEYNVNEESPEASEAEEEPIPSYNQQDQARTNHNVPQRDHFKSNFASQNRGERKYQPSHPAKNNQRGGNGNNFGGGKNRQQNFNKNRGGAKDWKQLAKESSRFSSGMYSNCIHDIRIVAL